MHCPMSSAIYLITRPELIKTGSKSCERNIAGYIWTEGNEGALYKNHHSMMVGVLEGDPAHGCSTPGAPPLVRKGRSSSAWTCENVAGFEGSWERSPPP